MVGALRLARCAGSLRRPGGRPPWWAPPQVLDTQAAAALASLAYLSIVGGYLGTLITQSLTFAADEFGADDGQQANTLGRHPGRGPAVARHRGVGRPERSPTGAAGLRHRRVRPHRRSARSHPGSSRSAASQIFARGLSTALGLLIVVVVAEEMPAGARAYGVSLLTMTGALGAGMVLWLLPLVDVDERAWRGLYVVPLLFLPLIAATAKLLPESRRFVRRHAARPIRRATAAGSPSSPAPRSPSPSSRPRRRSCRTSSSASEFSFSAAQITLFTILTVTPASIGIVVGGRLADTRGQAPHRRHRSRGRAPC